MHFIHNVYGVLETEDLKSLKGEKLLSYTQDRFEAGFASFLWLDMTRAKTEKIVVQINDRKQYLDLQLYHKIQERFQNCLDFYFVFRSKRYEEFLSPEDDILEEEVLTKEEIRSLLQKYKLKEDEATVERIFQKRTSFFDVKFRLAKKQEKRIGF